VKKQAPGAANKGGGHVYDPYSRKPTKVVQYWSTGRKGSTEGSEGQPNWEKESSKV
jgi:hypothetical protein